MVWVRAFIPLLSYPSNAINLTWNYSHCKNLKPQYEKAATSLQGLAKVAAVNCDEDVNKQFCGKMGIQGFPTLKIVKPSKKAGSKPVVEDYNGERTAKAIARAVKDKMPNRVARLKDDKFQEWLAKDTNKAKAIFFSDKSLVPSLVKALAIEFRDGIDIGFARPADKSVTEHFRIDSTPSLILIEKKDEEPVRFTGSFDKAEIVEFLSRAAQPQLEVFASKENKKSKKKTSSSRSKQQHEDLWFDMEEL